MGIFGEAAHLVRSTSKLFVAVFQLHGGQSRPALVVNENVDPASAELDFQSQSGPNSIAGLSRFPRIENIDAKTGEVFYVARDKREAMFNSGCGNHAVCRVEGCSS